jgi:outer membrane protein assembly factor BamB
VESSPSIADGKVIFGAGDDGVYCLDAETGRKLWQYPSVHVDGSPAIHDNRAYFGSGYGRSSVYCLNLDDGSEIWAADTTHPAWGSPAVWNGKVYIGTGVGNFVVSSEEPAGSVVCLDARTGESLWEFEVGGTILGAIAIDGGRAYFGSRDSNLYCVGESGEQIWRFTAGSAIVSSPAVVMGDVYFGSDNGRIYCLDKEDGILKWDFDTSESGFFNVDSRIIGSPAASGSKLFIGSMNFFFYCIAEGSEN